MKKHFKKLFVFTAAAAAVGAVGAWLFKNDKLPFGAKKEEPDDLNEDDFDEDLKDLFDDFQEEPAEEETPAEEEAPAEEEVPAEEEAPAAEEEPAAQTEEPAEEPASAAQEEPVAEEKTAAQEAE
ncbi:MAG: hypothetical protein LUF00_04920 [Lachnospiraceae bacterium]|nr:hypothetical protein [Lachnospiraceae bacterium]